MVTDGSNGLSHGLTFIDGACVHGLRAIGALIANGGLHNKSGHERTESLTTATGGTRVGAKQPPS